MKYRRSRRRIEYEKRKEGSYASIYTAWRYQIEIRAPANFQAVAPRETDPKFAVPWYAPQLERIDLGSHNLHCDCFDPAHHLGRGVSGDVSWLPCQSRDAVIRRI